MNTEYVSVVRLTIGAVFLWAAAGKLVHPVRFAEGLAAYVTLPSAALNALAAVLISLELALGVSHATGWLLAGGIPLALATLILFAVLVQRRLSQGEAGPCLCFGTTDDSERISQRTIARLGLLIIGDVLLLGYIGPWGGESLTVAVANAETRAFSPMIIVGTTIVLVLGTWSLRFNDVIWALQQSFHGHKPSSQS